MDTMDNTLKLKAFAETASCGGFTRAAKKLSCSQSGISRMISDLEKEWGVTLMERGRGGVSLTPDGEALLPYVRSVLAAQDDLERRVAEMKGLVTGKLRIGTFSSVATYWLPKIVRMFRLDYPHIEYEMLLGDYDEIEQWVREGRVDIGFTRATEDMDLDHEVLKRDPLMAVIPRNHPLAGEEKFPLAELAKGPFMLLEKGDRAEISELFDANGLEPDVVFTTWDDYAVMSMVESGLGMSILPELILHKVQFDIAVRPLDVPAYRDICVVMRDRGKLSIPAGRFMDYLKYRDL